MPEAEAKPSTLRWRRWQLKKKHPEQFVAALPLRAPMAAAPEARKRGRPCWPFDELSKEGQRKRVYRAGAAEKGAPLLLQLLDATAAVGCEEPACVEVQAETRAEAPPHRLLKQLATRNPAADGPRALTLRRAACVDGESECVIGSLCDAMDVSGASDPRVMRCCGHVMCALCLGEWLRRHGQQVDANYEDGVHTTEHTAPGRAIRMRMDTHRCPVCKARVQSVRRALA